MNGVAATAPTCWLCGRALTEDGACPRALEIGREDHRALPTESTATSDHTGVASLDELELAPWDEAAVMARINNLVATFLGEPVRG